MKLEKIELRSFRSYDNALFEFGEGINVICGANGTGKTNLLEAIYMLSGSRSWRAAKNADLISWDKDGAYIGALANTRGRGFEIKINMPARGKSTVLINDVKITRKSAMSEVLRCVVFSPEDLFLIKGAAARRRGLLDNCLCQMSPRYADELQRYEKILMSKQKMLKDGTDLSVMTEYNMQLAYYGASLALQRNKICREIEKQAKKYHSKISGGKEELKLVYKTMSVLDMSCTQGDNCRLYYERLAELKEAEIAAQSCLSGVHKDDIEVYINGRDAKSFASQGQSRTAAISLKFAQREILREGKDYPLLLLDDVLSELDPPRQRFITTNALGGQVFISCCTVPENVEGKLVEI